MYVTTLWTTRCEIYMGRQERLTLSFQLSDIDKIFKKIQHFSLEEIRYQTFGGRHTLHVSQANQSAVTILQLVALTSVGFRNVGSATGS
jgi:hypothetical protein